MKELRQIESKELTKIRGAILDAQGYKCAICGRPLNIEIANVDHQHKTKAEKLGVNGAGLIRGVLCRACNVFEGKIWNNSKRYSAYDNLVQWLHALANYLNDEPYPWIHPNEKPRPPDVSKRNYNKLAKLYAETKRRKKFPGYPKYKKLTKDLEKLFYEFEIEPYN